MKAILFIASLILWGSIALAQDTAYVSRDKVTALFFKTPVSIHGSTPPGYQVKKLESGLITVKVTGPDFRPASLDVQDDSSKAVYQIPMAFSYGRAGRRMEIKPLGNVVRPLTRVASDDEPLARQLALGKRKAVVDHKKTGGIKAWISSLSLAGNHIFFRLDIRN